MKIRYVLLSAMALSLAASGCAKKDNAAPVAPGHAANDNSGTAGNTNAGTGGAGTGTTTGGGTAAGGTAAGGTGDAAKQPASGGAGSANTGKPAEKPVANLPEITQDQFDKIGTNTTIDNLTSVVGPSIKVVDESGDKKTYEFKVKGKTNYYAKVVFKNGKYLEKSTFMM